METFLFATSIDSSATARKPCGFVQRARRDALWLSIGLALIFAWAYFTDGWERFVAFAESHPELERWELDELLVVAMFVPLAVMIYSIRRFRDLNRLFAEREQLVLTLQAANEEINESRSAIRTQALTDRLTGLNNRACLVECIETLLKMPERNQGTHAILFLDFDHFKRINDTYGHNVGDAFLKEVAFRLNGTLHGPNDVLARLGGDEFVALLPSLASPEEATAAAERVQMALTAPIDLNGRTIQPRASIGVLIIDETYVSSGEVLRDADIAMYEAKRVARGSYAVFNSEVRNTWVRHAHLESDLREAIARQELSVQYQPIVSLDNGGLYAVEALLRWKHAEYGPISPAEFIPLAEESDLIFEIGAWVFREACWQMAEWIARFGESAPGIMSINVSRKQFAQHQFCERIAGILRETGAPPERIQIEITEDLYVGDVKGAARCMEAMKKLGLRIAIDDFGVGSSTFAAISQFPIDVLKVDRSLVVDAAKSEDSAAILHSLAVLVRNLDITLVAEGVEEPEQVTSLQELGCHHAQGYLFGRPMPPDDLDAMLHAPGSENLTTTGAALWEHKWREHLKAFDELHASGLPSTGSSHPSASESTRTREEHWASP